ncbi:MAG: 4Fe-4S dicluster domain-containing protein [Clostridia bacterium]|nr:4Fe-4S dicluster domain-containing protein [Clostridia bacterium]
MSIIEQNNRTRSHSFEKIPLPSVLSVPLTLDGYTATPVVKAGDKVKKYEKIAVGDYIVHSPVSGTVQALSDEYAVIKNDFRETTAELIPETKTIQELSSEELCQRAYQSGIWCKTRKAPLDKAISECAGKVSRVIINLCEGQPFVSSAYRLCLDNIDAVLGGAKILMKACGVRRAVIAVDLKNFRLIKLLREKCGKSPLFSIKVITRGYPSENPRRLVYIVDGVESENGKNLALQGYGVFGARECYDFYTAQVNRTPSVNCFVTAEGDCISTPKNIIVPIGTSASYIAECCGGYIKEPHKIISGGAFDGEALWDSDQPVNKDSTAVVFLSDAYVKKTGTACIKCSRCVKYCPMFLMPLKIAEAHSKGKTEKCKELGAESCIQCGICSYVCPANITVTQKMAQAKDAVKNKENPTVF